MGEQQHQAAGPHNEGEASVPDSAYGVQDPSEEEVTREHNWQKRHACLYQINLSELYHRRRERSLDLADRTIKAIALFGGSAAFALAASQHAVQAASILIAATTAASLVFNFAGSARRHSSLASRFVKLESEIRKMPFNDITERDLAEWESRIAAIESDEPATSSRLVKRCQKDLDKALGLVRHPEQWQRDIPT